MGETGEFAVVGSIEVVSLHSRFAYQKSMLVDDTVLIDETRVELNAK